MLCQATIHNTLRVLSFCVVPRVIELSFYSAFWLQGSHNITVPGPLTCLELWECVLE